MRCDGTIEADIRETGSTPDGWLTQEPTGEATFTCGHGLTISGPRTHVAALAQLHTAIEPLVTRAATQSVFSRA